MHKHGDSETTQAQARRLGEPLQYAGDIAVELGRPRRRRDDVGREGAVVSVDLAWLQKARRRSPLLLPVPHQLSTTRLASSSGMSDAPGRGLGTSVAHARSSSRWRWRVGAYARQRPVPGLSSWRSEPRVGRWRGRGVGARRGLVVVVVGAARAGAGGARRTGLPSAPASLELHGR